MFQVLVLVAGLENVIEQLDQRTRKEVQVSSGNDSSVNRADISALVEIKGVFQKEYHQKSSKYSEFFPLIKKHKVWKHTKFHLKQSCIVA
jgi:predicted nuclease of restriction endonuclease-like RecB superfamily